MNNRRNIAAPFQNKEEQSKHTSNLPTKVEVHDGFVNFRNFTFPPLESLSELKFNKYCGPTPESNWVIPGVLLVGAYPASEDDEDTFELITSILKEGITKFVCLQSEYQAGVPRHIWQTGGALRPYFEDVREIVAKKHSIRELRGKKIVDIDKLSFEHCPIVDCGVTDDSKVVALAQKLVKDISEGQIIYLHCWGGHGRTGTVVCIMLYLLYGMSAAQAFAYCQAVHDLRTCPVEVGSPQTQTQRLQVVRVIDFLIAQHAELLLQQQDLAMKAFHAQLQVQAQAEADAAALALTAATQASAANGGAAVTATATVVTSCTTSSSVIQAHIVPDLSAPTEETKGKTVPPSVIARGPHAIQSPIKPPSAVVRETTQEHISQMNKHTMGIYHGYGNPYNGQNQSLGRKKANTGQPPLTAPSPKSTSFPAIGTPKNLNGHAANGERHSRTSSPMDVAASGAVLTLATAIKDKTPLDGAALLQTLQAHPPRNPPPQNGRSEALGKHPGRGYSASHTAAGEIYVPHSSDEGENSDGDDEDEGFIISQMVSRGNMLASRTNSATLVTDDGAADLAAGGAGAILPSAAPVTRMVSADDSAELGSIEMDVATTATLDDTMALSPYIDTPGGNTLGYISSSSVSRCGSRPLSMAVDSPLIAPSSVHSSVTSAPNTSASMDVSNKLGSPISPITPGGPLAALPAVRSVSDGDRDNQGSDFDESVRPASGAPAAATRLAATEPAPHSAPEKTSRRLSGTKVITNAFRAGIKILTGGGGSSSGNSTPEGTTKPNKKAAAAAALKQPPPPEPTLKVCTAEEAGHANARPAPLKTASTDSWTSTTTTVTMSQSQSSTNTPTNASASLTQEPAAAVVSVKMS